MISPKIITKNEGDKCISAEHKSQRQKSLETLAKQEDQIRVHGIYARRLQSRHRKGYDLVINNCKPVSGDQF